jgi:hypothetical protein
VWAHLDGSEENQTFPAVSNNKTLSPPRIGQHMLQVRRKLSKVGGSGPSEDKENLIAAPRKGHFRMEVSRELVDYN